MRVKRQALDATWSDPPVIEAPNHTIAPTQALLIQLILYK